MPAPSLSVNLPWQSLAANGQALSGLGGDPGAAAAQLGPLYNQSYQSALGLNSALFSGLQTNYDQLRSSVNDQYAGIQKGYENLYSDVLGRIAGTNQTNLTDINSAFNAQAGGASQDLINRGLGNSTTQSSVQRGIELDRQRALTASQNQFAQLGAGYANSIGQAGLGAQQQGIGMGANLGQAQLGMLERVQAPYPNAQLYSNLAQMYGSNLQRQQDQQRADQLQQRGANMLQSSGGMGVGGGSGNNTPFRGPPPSLGGGGYSGQGQDFPVRNNSGNGVFDQAAVDRLFNGGQAADDFYSGLGSGYGDPQAMAAVGGGAIGALGWGGYGSPMGGGDTSYYDAGYGGYVDPSGGY